MCDALFWNLYLIKVALHDAQASGKQPPLVNRLSSIKSTSKLCISYASRHPATRAIEVADIPALDSRRLATVCEVCLLVASHRGATRTEAA